MTRPYSTSSKYKGHVIRRLSKLDGAFRNSGWQADELRSLFIGSLVLELDNLIIQAFRAYGLMALREAQRQQLVAIPGRGRVCFDDEYPSIMREAGSRTPSMANVHFTVSKRDEPKVRDPTRLRTLLQVLTGGVPASFVNALALNCMVFSELRDIRHFYAHRCEETFRQAMHSNALYLRGQISHPDEFVAGKLPGRSTPKFVEWIAEAEAFFSVAA